MYVFVHVPDAGHHYIMTIFHLQAAEDGMNMFAIA